MIYFRDLHNEINIRRLILNDLSMNYDSLLYRYIITLIILIMKS